MIDMNQQYQTRDGRPVRILCTDGPGHYPVIGFVGESITSWTLDGATYDKNNESRDDLIEVSPWADFKIDEPVMVNIEGSWRKRYFAGISRNGKPMTWLIGSTRWSNEWDPIEYESVRRPTEEEMK